MLPRKSQASTTATVNDLVLSLCLATSVYHFLFLSLHQASTNCTSLVPFPSFWGLPKYRKKFWLCYSFLSPHCFLPDPAIALTFLMCSRLNKASPVRTTLTNSIPRFPIARLPCLQNHLYMIRMELIISLLWHLPFLATDSHSSSHPYSKCQYISYSPPWTTFSVPCQVNGVC